jgi:hypothetical protein
MINKSTSGLFVVLAKLDYSDFYIYPSDLEYTSDSKVIFGPASKTECNARVNSLRKDNPYKLEQYGMHK